MTLDTRTAARIYRERAVEGASPARLVRLLLERALRGIDTAAAADASDPRSLFVSELQRANDIVVELRLAIEPAAAPDVAATTDSLYRFVNDQLHTALAQRNAQPALLARPVLATLHDAWCKLEESAA